MEAYKNAIINISNQKKKIIAIDIGCARCAFLNEFLINYFNKENIEILGIDPLRHSGQFDASNHYNYYIQGCVDNIPENTVQEQTFYVNEIDQASSLLKIKTDSFTSNINNLENGFYYPQETIDRLSKIVSTINVNVYNLNDLIRQTIGSEKMIDFIKIDAEGKDLDIAKSLKKHFHKIRYIALECSSHNNDTLEIFENGCKLTDVIQFFRENEFDIFEHTDHSLDPNNLTQMSDVVFINKRITTHECL